MSHPNTKPIEITGKTTLGVSWQQSTLQWTFGESRAEAESSLRENEPVDRLVRVRNTPEHPTAGPQKVDAPEPPAVLIPSQRYGRRGLQPVREWEAVVESMDAEGFRCRLLLTTHGVAATRTIELTDFSYNDLASDDDQSLLAPGTVLYWTIGRARNAAGTVSNVSLLRVRRLPEASAAQKARADAEAEDLMKAFGG